MDDDQVEGGMHAPGMVLRVCVWRGGRGGRGGGGRIRKDGTGESESVIEGRNASHERRGREGTGEQYATCRTRNG